VDAEWMPACNATYKNGVTFKDWSTKPGYESYFHPFASMLGPVHPQRPRAAGQCRRARPSRPPFHRRGAGPHRQGPQAGAPLPVRRLIRLPLRLDAAGPVPAPQVRRARRAPPGAPRHSGAARRTRRHRPLAARWRRTPGRRLLRRLHRLRVAADRQGAADAVQVVLGQPVQRRGRRPALAHRGADQLADRLHRAEVRLGLEDPPDQSLRQRLRLQQRALLGRPAGDRAAPAPGPARCRHRAGAPQDARRQHGQALEPQLRGHRPGAGLHRAPRGDRAAAGSAYGDGAGRCARGGRPRRSRAGPLQCRHPSPLRRHARLHRRALQDELAHRYRLLARQRGQHEPVGSAARAARHLPGSPTADRRPAERPLRLRLLDHVVVRAAGRRRRVPGRGPAGTDRRASAVRSGHHRQPAVAQRARLPGPPRVAAPHSAQADGARAAPLPVAKPGPDQACISGQRGFTSNA
jgi:hypothetical protein